MCTIGSNHQVKLDLYFSRSGPSRIFGRLGVRDLEPSFVILEVRARKLVTEEKLDIGHSFQFVEEGFVQTAPVGCVECLFTVVRTEKDSE